MRALLPPTNRLPGEGDNAFAAFGRYLLSGWIVPESGLPRRVTRLSRAALNAEFGGPQVALWIRHFDWIQRATAYDSEVLSQNRKVVDETRALTSALLASVTADASAMLSVELHRAMDELAASGQVVPLKDLTRMIAEIGRTHALLAPSGIGGGNAPQKDYSNLPVEELERLARGE